MLCAGSAIEALARVFLPFAYLNSWAKLLSSSNGYRLASGYQFTCFEVLSY